ncbi:hypothetical protein J3F84DRAFT_345099 [Trichoderma pleuroticola]
MTSLSAAFLETIDKGNRIFDELDYQEVYDDDWISRRRRIDFELLKDCIGDIRPRKGLFFGEEGVVERILIAHQKVVACSLITHQIQLLSNLMDYYIDKKYPDIQLFPKDGIAGHATVEQVKRLKREYEKKKILMHQLRGQHFEPNKTARVVLVKDEIPTLNEIDRIALVRDEILQPDKAARVVLRRDRIFTLNVDEVVQIARVNSHERRELNPQREGGRSDRRGERRDPTPKEDLPNPPLGAVQSVEMTSGGHIRMTFRG